MSELQLPSDYERMRPFRRLVALLNERRFRNLTAEIETPNPADEVMCEMAASFLWNRLWVELHLLARSTNRPGWLPSEDRRTYEKTVAAIFGDNCQPVDLLVESGVLLALADGWMCEWFARLNPQSAGNHISKETRGAAGSALVRNERKIAAEATAQTMLFSPELAQQLFRKANDEPMTDTEIQRAMNCIKTLDNSLAYRRAQGEYTESLVQDAMRVIETYSPEQLREVYVWVHAQRLVNHVGAPKTTEEVLKSFPRYQPLAHQLANES